MACYAVFLASGHSLAQRQIKAATIRQYLFAASTFLHWFDPCPHRDARHGPSTHSNCSWLQKILKEVEKFETVADRQEPYTLAMHRTLLHKVTPLLSPSPDCRTVALFQWFGVALQGGNRRSEWCQPSGYRDIAKFELNPKSECCAFTLRDIQFLGPTKRVLPLPVALSAPETVAFATVTYRWQKNGFHGESKTYARNPNNPACDSVAHFLSICTRFVRLRGLSNCDHPLAIYRRADGRICNITSDDATTLLRDLAKTTYNITLGTGLARWTCHSLRVGACCILWAMGRSGDFIQRVLRWRSESWKLYVRDLSIQADQHNEAIDTCWELPTY